MAERKSGPVKPPVIDMKARSAETERDGGTKAESPAKPAPETAAETEAPALEPTPASAASEPLAEPARPAPPPPPRPPARLAMPWSAISIAAIGGALLGTALTYGLVNLVPLPDQRPVIADPAARLDAQDARALELASRLDALEEQGKRTQVSLDATITQLDQGLAELAPVDRRHSAPRRRSTSRRSKPACNRSRTASMRSAPAPRPPMPPALAQTISGLESGTRRAPHPARCRRPAGRCR